MGRPDGRGREGRVDRDDRRRRPRRRDGRAPRRGRRRGRATSTRSSRRSRASRAGSPSGAPSRPRSATPSPCCASGAAVLPLVERYHELKRSRDAMDFADQVALAARIATHRAPGRGGRAARASGRCCSTSSRTPPRPSCSCCASLFVAAGVAGSGHRGRRPAPVDLRVARRELDHAAPLPRGLRRPRARRWCCRCRRAGATTRAILDVANLVAEPLARSTRVPVASLARAAGGRARARRAPPGSRRSRTRPRHVAAWVEHRRSRGPVGAPQRCCAASVPSSTRSSRRWRRAASPTRSSASVASCTPRRSPTSSRCSGWCRTPPVATG